MNRSKGERGRGVEERRERRGRREARRYISYARGEVRRRSGGELSTAKAAQGVVCPFTLPSPSAFFCCFSGVLNSLFHRATVDFFQGFFFIRIYNESSCVKVRSVDIDTLLTLLEIVE